MKRSIKILNKLIDKLITLNNLQLNNISADYIYIKIYPDLVAELCIVIEGDDEICLEKVNLNAESNK